MRNQPRIQYAAFRAQCLGVSTEVLEAAASPPSPSASRIPHALFVKGAHAIITLRYASLSNRGADFWERCLREVDLLTC